MVNIYITRQQIQNTDKGCHTTSTTVLEVHQKQYRMTGTVTKLDIQVENQPWAVYIDWSAGQHLSQSANAPVRKCPS